MKHDRLPGRASVPTSGQRVRARRVWFIGALLLLTGCATEPPPQLAESVDISRMYGGWFLVATIPNWFEKGLVSPHDNFSLRPDGDIREETLLQRGFSAPRKLYEVHDWVRPDTGNAHWRVQIFWPINLPFLVLYVDPTYRYALFGEADRSLGWIFARDAEIPDADYQALLARFAERGYDPTKFLKFVQKPEDIGKPGYWSDGVTR